MLTQEEKCSSKIACDPSDKVWSDGPAAKEAASADLVREAADRLHEKALRASAN